MIKAGGCYRHGLRHSGMSQATATASRSATKCPHRHFLALYNPINQPIYIFLRSLPKLRFLRSLDLKTTIPFISSQSYLSLTSV